jgi:hypothetical protein
MGVLGMIDSIKPTSACWIVIRRVRTKPWSRAFYKSRDQSVHRPRYYYHDEITRWGISSLRNRTFVL